MINLPQPYVSIHPNGEVFLFNNPWFYNQDGEVVGRFHSRYPSNIKQTREQIHQFSLNRKKRTIHNALCVLSQTHVNRNICFVVTSPVPEIKDGLIKRFTHNFANGYKCVNYLWVREYQKNNRPHWHFVADVPHVNFESLGLWWCNLSCNSGLSNSVRLNPPRSRYLDTNYQGCLDYLRKYITKDFTTGGNSRSFAISQDLQAASRPQLVHAAEWWPQNASKYHWRDIKTAGGFTMRAGKLLTI